MSVVKFNEIEHKYEVIKEDGSRVELPSVTTILNAFPKGKGLQEFFKKRTKEEAAKKGAKYITPVT
jgi:hypothetical protein